MIAMNYSTLRSHMKYAFDACCDDMETLIVTRKDNRNVVVLSEESYNNLMENLYVRASKKNYDRLLTSIAQAKGGSVKRETWSKMNKAFTDIGGEDYLYWQTEDRKTLRKINTLLKDIERNGNEGIGKPEPLTGDLSGFWSRRINQTDRLIYALEMDQIIIIACRYHYDDT